MIPPPPYHFVMMEDDFNNLKISSRTGCGLSELALYSRLSFKMEAIFDNFSQETVRLLYCLKGMK